MPGQVGGVANLPAPARPGPRPAVSVYRRKPQAIGWLVVFSIPEQTSLRTKRKKKDCLARVQQSAFFMQHNCQDIEGRR